MTLLRETPKDHGRLLDHDPRGRRLFVTRAGKTPRRNGRRVQHIATILWRHHGQRLRPQEKAARQYPSHRRHAPLRKQLVVRLPPEPQPPPQSAGRPDAAVWVMALLLDRIKGDWDAVGMPACAGMTGKSNRFDGGGSGG